MLHPAKGWSIFIFLLFLYKISTMDKEYFSNRRSVRSFKDTAVAPELIEEIVALASKAPTTGNMQLYSVIATTRPEQHRELAKLHFNQPASTGAAALLTVCADFTRFERWCQLNDAKPGFSNWEGLLYGFFDATIFAQQIVTIAEGLGLGTCYLGTTTFTAPDIATLLQLPARVIPLTTIAIGYPAEEGVATERIKQHGILHFGTYSNFSDEDIADIYRPKDEFDDNKKFVTENGKANLAQVFTDIRYPEAMNAEFSLKWKEYLRSICGFDI